MQWWNQSLDELCRTQHRTDAPPVHGAQHERPPHSGSLHRHDGAERGSQEPRRDPALSDPPPVTHAVFLQMIRSWLDAQGLDDGSPRWQGDKVDCGCVPLHYEIVIDTMFSSPSSLAAAEKHDQRDRPHHVHGSEDHYTGEGSGTFTVSNLSCLNGCTIDYLPAATNEHLEGEVKKGDGAPDELKMNVTRSVGDDLRARLSLRRRSQLPLSLTVFRPSGSSRAWRDRELSWMRASAPTIGSSPPGTLTITIRKRN